MGWWEVTEELHTIFFPALPHDSAKCLQSKEKGIQKQWNRDRYHLHMDHKLRQKPGIGTWLSKLSSEGKALI